MAGGARAAFDGARRPVTFRVAAERELLERLTGAGVPAGDQFALIEVPNAVLKEFARRQPNVAVRLRELNIATQIREVRAGRADAAFLWGPNNETELAFERVVTEPRMVALPADHPLASAQRRAQQSLLGRRYRRPSMDVVPLMPRPDVEDYTRLANELVAGGGVDATWVEAVGMPEDRFVQGSIDRAVARARAERPSTLADAQRLLARAHGFERWPEFADHVDAIAGNAFEAAADAVVGGDERRSARCCRRTRNSRAHARGGGVTRRSCTTSPRTASRTSARSRRRTRSRSQRP